MVFTVLRLSTQNTSFYYGFYSDFCMSHFVWYLQYFVVLVSVAFLLGWFFF